MYSSCALERTTVAALNMMRHVKFVSHILYALPPSEWSAMAGLIACPPHVEQTGVAGERTLRFPVIGL